MNQPIHPVFFGVSSPLTFYLTRNPDGSSYLTPSDKTLKSLHIPSSYSSTLNVPWKAFSASAKLAGVQNDLANFILNSRNTQAVIITNCYARMIDSETFAKAEGNVLMINASGKYCLATTSGDLIRYLADGNCYTLTAKWYHSLRVNVREYGNIEVTLNHEPGRRDAERKIEIDKKDLARAMDPLNQAIETCFGLTEQQMRSIADETFMPKQLPKTDPERCSKSILAAFEQICRPTVPVVAEHVLLAPPTNFWEVLTSIPELFASKKE